MKKTILLICLLIAGTAVYSQKEILSVDFETVPAGFKTFNLDGLKDDCGTPGEFSKGWLLSTSMGFGGGIGKYAKDCSDHGTNISSKADDWIVSRGIKVGSSSVIVSWINFSEWDQNILLYASKSFNGTAADLSKFKLISTVSNGAWTFNSHTESLNSLALVPGDSLYVAFRNNVAHKGQFFMDNLVVSEALNRDGAVVTYDSKLYSSKNDVPLKGKIYNYGASPISSYTLNWAVNGGAVKTQTFSGLNITTSNYHFFETNGNVNYNQGDNVLKMFISNVNGAGQDDEKMNDTLVEHVYIINSPTVTKNVLIGDYTGTWCGNCVDAFPIIDSLVKASDRFIAVAMHVQSDPMTTPQAAPFTTKYNISAFPMMTFDMRAFNPKSNTTGILGGAWPCLEWRKKAGESLTELSPVEVSTVYKIDPSTRVLTVTVKANFKDAGAFGDLRLNCFVIESPVTGPSTGNGQTNYDQTNYRDLVKGHPFYGLGDHIKGFKHQHVFRNALGGINGTAGVIPSLVTKGQQFQKQYTYQIPASYNINNIHAVGFVNRYSANNLYNPVYNSSDHEIITGIDDAGINDDDIMTYPNPADNEIAITVKGTGKISIYNTLAQEISSQNFNSESSGTVSINTSGLHMGIYFLKINCDKKIITKKITIHHP